MDQWMCIYLELIFNSKNTFILRRSEYAVDVVASPRQIDVVAFPRQPRIVDHTAATCSSAATHVLVCPHVGSSAAAQVASPSFFPSNNVCPQQWPFITVGAEARVAGYSGSTGRLGCCSWACIRLMSVQWTRQLSAAQRLTRIVVVAAGKAIQFQSRSVIEMLLVSSFALFCHMHMIPFCYCTVLLKLALTSSEDTLSIRNGHQLFSICPMLEREVMRPRASVQFFFFFLNPFLG